MRYELRRNLVCNFIRDFMLTVHRDFLVMGGLAIHAPRAHLLAFSECYSCNSISMST